MQQVDYARVYWLSGTAPKDIRLRYEVSNPPNSGWATAFVARGEKRSTLFCPFTLQSFQVTNGSAEVSTAVREELTDERRKRLAGIILGNWEMYQRLGLSADYDVAALVLTSLGAEVPTAVLKDGVEDTTARGGKETAPKLLKPVKRSGKRGRFLEWFIQAGLTAAVRAAMAEFGMSRSSVLSMLYNLQKDHGIGYTLVGDSATIAMPEGCTDPWEAAA